MELSVPFSSLKLPSLMVHSPLVFCPRSTSKYMAPLNSVIDDQDSLHAGDVVKSMRVPIHPVGKTFIGLAVVSGGENMLPFSSSRRVYVCVRAVARAGRGASAARRSTSAAAAAAAAAAGAARGRGGGRGCARPRRDGRAAHAAMDWCAARGRAGRPAGRPGETGRGRDGGGRWAAGLRAAGRQASSQLNGWPGAGAAPPALPGLHHPPLAASPGCLRPQQPARRARARAAAGAGGHQGTGRRCGPRGPRTHAPRPCAHRSQFIPPPGGSRGPRGRPRAAVAAEEGARARARVARRAIDGRAEEARGTGIVTE
jgi:hypothetical protein